MLFSAYRLSHRWNRGPIDTRDSRNATRLRLPRSQVGRCCNCAFSTLSGPGDAAASTRRGPNYRTPRFRHHAASRDARPRSGFDSPERWLFTAIRHPHRGDVHRQLHRRRARPRRQRAPHHARGGARGRSPRRGALAPRHRGVRAGGVHAAGERGPRVPGRRRLDRVGEHRPEQCSDRVDRVDRVERVPLTVRVTPSPPEVLPDVAKDGLTCTASRTPSAPVSP